jgi:hypothetical protein
MMLFLSVRMILFFGLGLFMLSGLVLV